MEKPESTLDTAREDTINLFDSGDLDTPPESVPEENGTPEAGVPEEAAQQPEQQAPEQGALEDAVHTAEQAAQAAQQKDMELQQVMQELQALRGQNEQLQQTISQMSEVQKESIIEEATQPPMIDINGLAFSSQDEINAAQAEYASQMAQFTESQIMKKLEPFIKQAKEGMREKEKNEFLAMIANHPILSGAKDMMPQMEAIIKQNPRLFGEGVPLDEAMVAAYIMINGVNALEQPKKKELSTDELMALYNSNTEFKDMVEKQRLDELNKDSQQVPPLTSSSGAVNAALNIPKAPETLDEASKRVAREIFNN